MSTRILPVEAGRAAPEPWALEDIAAREALHAALRAHRFTRPAGTLLRGEGEPGGDVLAVLTGWLALTKSMEDGERQIIDFVLPGGLVLPGPDPMGASVVSVEAVTEVALSAIPLATWTRLKSDHPVIARLETALMAGAIDRMSERLLRIGKGSAQMRVAHALIELCARAGALDRAERRPVHLPLTQGRLGDYTGLSSVHVCRTMRKLVRMGLVTVADHMDLVIRDPVALADLAGLDPDRAGAVPALRAAV